MKSFQVLRMGSRVIRLAFVWKGFTTEGHGGPRSEELVELLQTRKKSASPESITSIAIIGGMLHDECLTREIIGSAIEVHRALGPGLLERVYQDALACELMMRGLTCVREHAIPIRYKDRLLPSPMRIDILVEDRVILEVKSVREVLDVHRAQLMTYLKLRGGGIGFLLNFNVTRMIDGVIRRAV